MSQSEAIRSLLLASADRLRKARELAAEVAALESDEDDRAEMIMVAELMESMRASGDVHSFFPWVGAANSGRSPGRRRRQIRRIAE